MAEVTYNSVQYHFDTEAREGRRLLPNVNTVTGLGTFVKYKKAADHMADPGVQDVLDIGCNRGSIEVLFHQQNPEKATRTSIDGVDISTEAIKQAQLLGVRNCTFQAYNGVSLPFSDNSFDLVVMVEVIEHVIKKEDLLMEIHRVLRPRGRFFFTTPNPDCWTLRLESFMWRALRRVFRRRQLAKDAFISAPALELMAKRVGLVPNSKARLYFWPHLFIAFEGWSLFPPLPPKWLFHYQKMCSRLEGNLVLPEFLERRLKWSLMGLYQKGDTDRGSKNL